MARYKKLSNKPREGYVETASLEDVALDIFIALENGFIMERPGDLQMQRGEARVLVGIQPHALKHVEYSPSNNEHIAGRIQDKDNICVRADKILDPDSNVEKIEWTAWVLDNKKPGALQVSDKRKTAILRASLQNKYGDEIADPHGYSRLKQQK